MVSHLPPLSCQKTVPAVTTALAASVHGSGMFFADLCRLHAGTRTLTNVIVSINFGRGDQLIT